jgi:hypothetical protein
MPAIAVGVKGSGVSGTYTPSTGTPSDHQVPGEVPRVRLCSPPADWQPAVMAPGQPISERKALEAPTGKDAKRVSAPPVAEIWDMAALPITEDAGPCVTVVRLPGGAVQCVQWMIIAEWPCPPVSPGLLMMAHRLAAAILK